MSRRRLRSLTLGCLLLSLLAPVPGSATDRAIVPQPLPGTGSSLTWEAPQFLQADAKGRVFVLRGDTLDVFPVTRRGELGEPARLQGAKGAEAVPLRAVMGSAGDDWLIFYGPGRPLLWFRGGKPERMADPIWQIESIGLQRDSPVAAVLPYRLGPESAKSLTGPAPSLLAYGAERWSSLLAGGPAPDKAGGPGRMDTLTEHSAWILGDFSGKLWLAHTYRYSILRLSAAGKPLFEITVGAVEPSQLSGPESKKATEQLKAEAGKLGVSESRGGRLSAMTAQQAIRALADGRDGRLYLLTYPESGPFLDRYDPARDALERVALQLDRPESITSLASGHDGLYLAGFRGTDGRYLIPWEVLDAAPWRAVAGAKIGSRAH